MPASPRKNRQYKKGWRIWLNRLFPHRQKLHEELKGIRFRFYNHLGSEHGAGITTFWHVYITYMWCRRKNICMSLQSPAWLTWAVDERIPLGWPQSQNYFNLWITVLDHCSLSNNLSQFSWKWLFLSDLRNTSYGKTGHRSPCITTELREKMPISEIYGKGLVFGKI